MENTTQPERGREKMDWYSVRRPSYDTCSPARSSKLAPASSSPSCRTLGRSVSSISKGERGSSGVTSQLARQ